MTGSFVDYTLPTTADTINFVTDNTTSLSTTNTLGTKGVGEAGTIASTPAVVNAIVDAVRDRGIHDIQMPCTPHGSGRRCSRLARPRSRRPNRTSHEEAANNADPGTTGEGSGS